MHYSRLDIASVIYYNKKNRKDLTFSSLLRYNFTLRFLGGKDEAYICGASKEVV